MRTLSRKSTKKVVKSEKLEKGYILYKGASVLNDAPIVAILTTKSNNIKTGNTPQIWILSDQLSPVDASYQKLDDSVCGNCPLKQNIGGACYVNLGQAPRAVYDGYKRGIYKDITKANKYPKRLIELLNSKPVRFGAYGDPAAVPYEIWAKTLEYAKSGHTAYTHQFNHKQFDKRMMNFCMVSTETLKGTLKAQELGRTFRVGNEGGQILPNEIECPSDSEGIQCIDCRLCDGNMGDSVQNIVIRSHGKRSKMHDKQYSKANIIQTIAID